MSRARSDDSPDGAPRRVVASAIQDLVAARLGRGFVPMALLFLGGLLEVGLGASTGAGLALAAGALASAASMLAHGLRVVQEAFARPRRAWMLVARWTAAFPLVYGLYVLGWRGLRELALGGGLDGLGLGILFAVMGSWVLRAWVKVVEVEHLARVMTFGLERTGDEA